MSNRLCKLVLVAALVAALGAWLCACGGGGSTDSGRTADSADKAPAKELRDGFVKETNQKLTIGGVTYSVPEYYELDEDSSKDDEKFYYAETGESVVMLYCTAPDVEYTGTKDYEDYIEGVIGSIEDATLDDSDTEMEINGMPAAYFTFHGTVSDSQVLGKGWLLHNPDVDNISVLMLAQSDNSEYDYVEDFDKIVLSAKPQKKQKKQKKSKVSRDFKKTMDDYEEFFDEYVEFMKKYQDSDDTLGMLSDYTDYMTKYAEVMKDLESIDQDELSDEDLAYYIEVNARIQKKLLEVSGN